MRDDPTFGDLAALRARMVIWAKRLTHGASNTEDLVQCALIKMLAHRSRAPADIGQIDQWARVVLLNTFRDERRRYRATVSLDAVLLIAPENPETQTYCRQVMRVIGLNAAFLLAEPETPQTPTQRSKRFRARRDLAAVAA